MKVFSLIYSILPSFLPTIQASQVAPSSYVALGDSFAAGLGYGRVLDEKCGRTSYSYGELFRHSHPGVVEYENFACGSQGIDDIQDKQAFNIRPATQLVSITAGLWDLDIPNTIKHCDVGYDEFLCNLGIETAERLVKNVTGEFTPYPRMLRLVDYVRKKAKKATVVIIGYPAFYTAPLASCVTWDGMKQMLESEKRRLNYVVRFLNSRYWVIANRVFQNHDPPVIFKNPDNTFIDHRVCDDYFWLKQYPRTVPTDFYENAWTKYGYYHPTQHGDDVYRYLLQEGWDEAKSEDRLERETTHLKSRTPSTCSNT